MKQNMTSSPRRRAPSALLIFFFLTTSCTKTIIDPPTPGNTQCAQDEDCSSEKICVGGRCNDFQCDATIACPLSELYCTNATGVRCRGVCTEHRCLPALPVGDPCEFPSDCEDDQTCILGVCVESSVGFNVCEECKPFGINADGQCVENEINFPKRANGEAFCRDGDGTSEHDAYLRSCPQGTQCMPSSRCCTNGICADGSNLSCSHEECLVIEDCSDVFGPIPVRNVVIALTENLSTSAGMVFSCLSSAQTLGTLRVSVPDGIVVSEDDLMFVGIAAGDTKFRLGGMGLSGFDAFGNDVTSSLGESADKARVTEMLVRATVLTEGAGGDALLLWNGIQDGELVSPEVILEIVYLPRSARCAYDQVP